MPVTSGFGVETSHVVVEHEGVRGSDQIAAVTEAFSVWTIGLYGEQIAEKCPLTHCLDAVEQLVEDTVLRSDLVEHLTGIRDLERLLAKVSVGQATPRDLGGLRTSLQNLPDWAALFPFELDRPLSNLIGEIDLLDDLFLELDKTLVDEPPIDPNEGGSIRQGYNSQLDEMVQMASSGRTFIAQLEHQERERTGISSLKIKFNRVFGYFLEVTKPNLHLVPENYRRKQTTAPGASEGGARAWSRSARAAAVLDDRQRGYDCPSRATRLDQRPAV